VTLSFTAAFNSPTILLGAHNRLLVPTATLVEHPRIPHTEFRDESTKTSMWMGTCRVLHVSTTQYNIKEGLCTPNRYFMCAVWRFAHEWHTMCLTVLNFLCSVVFGLHFCCQTLENSCGNKTRFFIRTRICAHARMINNNTI